MKIAADRPLAKFDYVTLGVRDLTIKTMQDPKSKSPRQIAQKIVIQGEEMDFSGRFWNSLFSRYGINSSLFKYYDYAEVFDRISEREANDRIRVCVERPEKPTDQPRLQGVSNPDKVLISYDELVDLLERNKVTNASYADGVIESFHIPRVGSEGFELSGDKFVNRFVMATPIDGYGQPNIYLSLLRTICSNGIVGYAKAFKSGLALGKGQDDAAPTVIRALDQFNSEEGFAAIRERLEASQRSWASVYETEKLYKLCLKLYTRKVVAEENGLNLKKAIYLYDLWSRTETSQPVAQVEQAVGLPILRAFHQMTGDTQKIYGLANLDSLSAKRQRTLPVKATVYDVMNFATELATHYMLPAGARILNGYVGELLTEEFDMENTRDTFSDFKDFMIERKVAAGLDEE